MHIQEERIDLWVEVNLSADDSISLVVFVEEKLVKFLATLIQYNVSGLSW